MSILVRESDIPTLDGWWKTKIDPSSSWHRYLNELNNREDGEEKKYKVLITCEATAELIVTARSEEEAEEIAEDKAQDLTSYDYDADCDDWSLESVDEVE